MPTVRGITGVPALRVLVVDDNQDTCEAMLALIQAWGHVAKVAKDGASAVRLAAEFHPIVVLMDLSLPDRHGYEVAKQIRREAGAERVFFVAITGWNQIADQLQSTAAGISHHLVKPVNHGILKEILAAYRVALDRRQVARNSKDR
jgi:CheY-like chemotaxis protein